MKKFIAGLVALVLAALPFTATGCNNLSDKGWTEVQSITYTINSTNTTLTSTYSWNTTREDIEKDEYENAPNELKTDLETLYYFLFSKKIDTNRKEFKETAESMKGKTYYFYSYDYLYEPYAYGKITFNNYELNYVKIKFSNNAIEIDYDNELIKISPTSYEITYFIN